MTKGALTLVAVGDVFLDRPKPDEPFTECEPYFRSGDVVFANLEGAFSHGGRMRRFAAFGVVGDLKALPALKRAGIDVLSCANNHIVDAGEDALVTMLERLHDQRIATAGAGATIDEARKPAIVRRKGRRVATLAYSSVFPFGHDAGPEKPGLAPLRAHNAFVETPGYWFPGYLPDVRTIPFAADVHAFVEDIRRARKRSELLIVSVHWGDHSRPAVVSDHEVRMAHLAIDEGADIVLGHHHHLLRGVEIYKDKPIFYGLGHFIFDIRNWNARIGEAGVAEEKRRYGDYGLYERPGYPLLPFHPEGRWTIMARCVCNADETIRSEFLPCVIDPDGHAIPLDPRHGEGLEITTYMRTIQDRAALNATFEVDEDSRWGEFPAVVVHA